MKQWKWFDREEVESWPEGHKRCRSCLEILPFSEFHKQKQTLLGYNTECKICRKPQSKKDYYSKSMEQLLWERAKSRAARNGRDFSISISDIVIPNRCPILGIEISARGGGNSPSLDRIDSSLGYVPGNIQVVSTRANTLKNNATLEELEAVAAWVKGNATIEA